MKIQQSNIKKPTSRGLYFVKTRPVCNQYFNYSNIAEQKITKKGIKYIEDTVIKTDIKNMIAQIPFVKKMAKCFDIFIVYEEEKTAKLFNEKDNEYRSSVDMYVATNDTVKPERFIFQGRDDYSLDNARKKCLNLITQKDSSKTYSKGERHENPKPKCI